MFDIWLRRRIDPVLDRIAVASAKVGVTANQLTFVGALFGLGAAASIAGGLFALGLALIGVNRFFDGLDGAVARTSSPTAWGGYLDSLADYVFYVAVPLGFAFYDPANIWPMLLLVSSFVLTAVSFLALAAILAGRDLGHGSKAFTYTSGFVEGAETIAAFILMCLLPHYVPVIAAAFAGLCLLTAIQRLWRAKGLLE